MAELNIGAQCLCKTISNSQPCIPELVSGSPPEAEVCVKHETQQRHHLRLLFVGGTCECRLIELREGATCTGGTLVGGACVGGSRS